MAGRRTILMVEDEKSITVPLSEALDREGFDTQVAGTVAEAIARPRTQMPDLVLLDVMLPDGSGYDVARTLRERSKVPIIMLTARGEETDRIVGLELGADDYIVKPFSAREVAARIRAVLRRAGDGPAAAAPAADGQAGPARGRPRPGRPDRREASVDGKELDLTRKEFELLELLIREAGTVISRERLIDEVWDTNWFGSTKTLDVHVSSLRRKLGDDSAEPPLHPHRPRRGLPLRLRRRAMSLRTRLVLAFTYVLVLVIVALEVPLALNLSKRVDAEIKNEAHSQTQLVAAGASSRMNDERQLKRLVKSSGQTLGGRVIVVDARGRVLADSSADATQGDDYGTRPEIRTALERTRRPGRAPQRLAERRPPLHRRPVPVGPAGRWAPCA